MKDANTQNEVCKIRHLEDIRGIQDTMRQGLSRFKKSDTMKMDKRNSRYESMNHESNQAI
jgi:hypothetical protein